MPSACQSSQLQQGALGIVTFLGGALQLLTGLALHVLSAASATGMHPHRQRPPACACSCCISLAQSPPTIISSIIMQSFQEEASKDRQSPHLDCGTERKAHHRQTIHPDLHGRQCSNKYHLLSATRSSPSLLGTTVKAPSGRWAGCRLWRSSCPQTVPPPPPAAPLAAWAGPSAASASCLLQTPALAPQTCIACV